MKSKVTLALVLSAALAPSLFAGEGMWMPEQVPGLASELARSGLKVDPRKLADLTGDP